MSLTQQKSKRIPAGVLAQNTSQIFSPGFKPGMIIRIAARADLEKQGVETLLFHILHNVPEAGLLRTAVR